MKSFRPRSRLNLDSLETTLVYTNHPANICKIELDRLSHQPSLVHAKPLGARSNARAFSEEKWQSFMNTSSNESDYQ